MLAVDLLKHAVFVSLLVVGYYQLTRPGELFGFWAKWINDLYKKITTWGFDEMDARSAMYNVRSRFNRYQWILKPLIECPRCTGGQWGFWSYALMHEINLHNLLLAVVVGILTSVMASIFYRQSI